MFTFEKNRALAGSSHLEVAKGLEQILEIRLHVVMVVVQCKSLAEGVKQIIVLFVCPMTSSEQILLHHLNDLRHFGLHLERSVFQVHRWNGLCVTYC